jgi:hypothetical protein
MTDFNTNTATVIIVHGYTESHDSNTVKAIRDGTLLSLLLVPLETYKLASKLVHFNYRQVVEY